MSRIEESSLQDAWQLLDLSKKAKILYQLESITKRLSQLRFNSIKSLFMKDDIFQIDTCLSRDLLQNQRDSIEKISRESFECEQDYHETHIRAFLENVKYLPLASHFFFALVFTRKKYHDDEKYRVVTT